LLLLFAQEMSAQDGFVEHACQVEDVLDLVFPGHMAVLAVERQGDFRLKYLVSLHSMDRGVKHAFSVSKLMYIYKCWNIDFGMGSGTARSRG